MTGGCASDRAGSEYHLEAGLCQTLFPAVFHISSYVGDAYIWNIAGNVGIVNIIVGRANILCYCG